MSIKDIIKSSGPLRFLTEHIGPNRAKRRREMATKRKQQDGKLLTSQARKRKRRARKQRRKQGAGLRKA